MELKYTNLQKELLTLREKIKAANSLQEAVKLHGHLSIMAAHFPELNGSLRNTEERYTVSSNSLLRRRLVKWRSIGNIQRL